MTSNSTNSVLSVLAQATNNDGTRKSGVWPTKGYDMLQDGTISAEIDTQGAIINGKHIPTAVLTAKALQPVFEGGETLAQWLGYTSNGFISFQQQRAASGPVQSTVKAATIDESAMSADEREAYYISLAKPQSPNIVSMLSTVNDANIDIDTRLSTLAEVQALLKAYKAELKKPVVLTDEQLASLAMQRERETHLTIIHDMGATITKAKTKDSNMVYMAKVTIADMANVINAIMSNFELIGSPAVNTKDMTATVTFKDKV